MNILILNGSPRHHGNTHAVLGKMREILEENHRVEILGDEKLDTIIKEAVENL